MTFEAFLKQAAGTGAGAVVGLVMSLLAEYVPWYANLAPKWKRAAMFAVCLIVPLVASVILVSLGKMPNDIESTYWPALIAGVAAFTSSTLTHTRKLAGDKQP